MDVRTRFFFFFFFASPPTPAPPGLPGSAYARRLQIHYAAATDDADSSSSSFLFFWGGGHYLDRTTQGVPKRYTSIASFVTHTKRESGLKGLFRGMSPALAMVAPQMGVSFAVYELVKGAPPHRWVVSSDATPASAGSVAAGVAGTGTEIGERSGLRIGGGREDAAASGLDPARGRRRGGEAATAQRREALEGGGPRGGAWDGLIETAWPLAAGAVAGMASKLAVFPLDTVKKRVQTEVRCRRRWEGGGGGVLHRGIRGRGWGGGIAGFLRPG